MRCMGLLNYQGWGGECSGRTQPGTAGLQRFCAVELDAWGTLTSGPYGTYNCRPPSLHGEGRAGDVGFAYEHDGLPNAGGKALVKFLMHYGEKLGIQEIIWDRIRYTDDYPKGKEYTGPSAHTDHVHWSQRWWHARNLTYAKVQDICGGARKPLIVVSKDDIDYTGRNATKECKSVQDALNYVLRAGLEEDGYWGRLTREAYENWEERRFGGGDGLPGRPGLRALARVSGSFRAT